MRTWASLVGWVLLAVPALAQAPVELPPPSSAIVDPLLPPEEPPPPKIWSGGVELGLNGAQGNSDLTQMRAAGEAVRDTPFDLWKTTLLYRYANANGVNTENRALLTSRYECKFGADSPWSWFVRGELEYDEFRDFDLRLAGHTGIGYLFLKNDRTLLRGRFGAGGSQKIGSEDDPDFRPELLVGGDFEHRISERQKVSTTLDVFPSVGDFGKYRAELRAAYELLVDPEWNLTLKLGCLDRYDSDPGTRKRNDLEYFLVLLWKF